MLLTLTINLTKYELSDRSISFVLIVTNVINSQYLLANLHWDWMTSNSCWLVVYSVVKTLQNTTVLSGDDEVACHPYTMRMRAYKVARPPERVQFYILFNWIQNLITVWFQNSTHTKLNALGSDLPKSENFILSPSKVVANLRFRFWLTDGSFTRHPQGIYQWEQTWKSGKWLNCWMIITFAHKTMCTFI